MNLYGDVSGRCNTFHATVLATEGGAMAMQSDKKPRLLQKMQILVLAAELEKTEAEEW